jgi:FkbM family methyltransferase
MGPVLTRFRRKILRRLDPPGLLTVGERTFLIPQIQDDICAVTEPWMVDLLAWLFTKKSGAFLDVGVNLGQTLLAVKAAEHSRKYVGVEPNAHCVAYTERLIAMNRLSNCQIVPVGLANQTGLRRLQLYDGETVDSSASLVESFRPDQKVTANKIVPVFPFEAIEQATGLLRLGIVKIDVEGSEADVLHSMLGSLKRDRPWLVVEILPCYQPKNVERISRQEAVEALLADAEFVKLRIIKQPDGRLERLLRIDRIGIHGHLDWCDYLILPREDVATLDPPEILHHPG